MKALKKIVEIGEDKSITIGSLPFKAGSRVEVIIFPADEKMDVFNFMDKVVQKKNIPTKSLKEIEDIVHSARGL